MGSWPDVLLVTVVAVTVLGRPHRAFPKSVPRIESQPSQRFKQTTSRTVLGSNDLQCLGPDGKQASKNSNLDQMRELTGADRVRIILAIIIVSAALIQIAQAQGPIPEGSVQDGEPCMDPPADEITASKRCAGSPFLSGKSTCSPGPAYYRSDGPGLQHSPWLCKDSGFDCAFPGTHGALIGHIYPKYFMDQNVFCLPDVS